ncbi:MAG TPA: DUF2304 domain-containing protein [Blastocatellia bacterium]|nr:DUF2304 domain-containing protein [Blastocatellia bacterium]
MLLPTKVLIALASLAIMLVIIMLVRYKRLDEKHALLWLVTGLVMLFAPILSKIVDSLSYKLGFFYPPSFVFLVAFFALCLISLQHSVIASRLTKHNKQLAQRYALLEQRLSEIESRFRSESPDRA